VSACVRRTTKPARGRTAKSTQGIGSPYGKALPHGTEEGRMAKELHTAEGAPARQRNAHGRGRIMHDKVTHARQHRCRASLPRRTAEMALPGLSLPCSVARQRLCRADRPLCRATFPHGKETLSGSVRDSGTSHLHMYMVTGARYIHPGRRRSFIVALERHQPLPTTRRSLVHASDACDGSGLGPAEAGSRA
jgi:hypothetical protein